MNRTTLILALVLLTAAPLAAVRAGEKAPARKSAAAPAATPLKVELLESMPTVAKGAKKSLEGKLRNPGKRALTVQDVTLLSNGDAVSLLPGEFAASPLRLEPGAVSPVLKLVSAEGVKVSAAGTRCELLLLGGETDGDRELLARLVFTIKVGEPASGKSK